MPTDNKKRYLVRKIGTEEYVGLYGTKKQEATLYPGGSMLDSILAIDPGKYETVEVENGS